VPFIEFGLRGDEIETTKVKNKKNQKTQIKLKGGLALTDSSVGID
jgi:hypothetical protein